MNISHSLFYLLTFQIALMGIIFMIYGRARPRIMVQERITRLNKQDNDVPRLSRRRQLLIDRLVLRDIDTADQDTLYWYFGNFKIAEKYVGLAFLGMRIFYAFLIGGFLGLFYWISQNAYPEKFLLAPMLILSFYVSWKYTKSWAAKATRDRNITTANNLPYALDLILICLDSGLGLESAIERVSKELRTRQPDIANELDLTLADLNVLGSQEEAFQAMAERLDTQSVRSVVAIICQSLQYGSAITEALKNAIQLMRRTEIIMLEERANKLPSKITLITLLFIFPPMLVVIAGPAVLNMIKSLSVL